MKNTNESTEITELSTWDMSDTVRKYDSRRWKEVEIPEPTPKNMLILMDKINELINTVNELKQCLIIAPK